MKLASVKLNRSEIARIENGFNTRLKLAALTVQGEMARLTSLQDGTIGIGRVTKPTHFLKVGKRKAVRRSKWGESPYRQTGKLSQTMMIDLLPARFSARIGPGQFYGTILELKLNRPHIAQALRNKEADVRRILST